MVNGDEVQECWNPALAANLEVCPPAATGPQPADDPDEGSAHQELFSALLGERRLFKEQLARATWASQRALECRSLDRVVRADSLRASALERIVRNAQSLSASMLPAGPGRPRRSRAAGAGR